MEITQKQAESQLALTRIKEISTLIPKLGSNNREERKFSAIAMGLYGESAIPALIAVFEDDDIEVQRASADALAIIGDVAIPPLREGFSDMRNSSRMRGMCLYTLGLMKADNAFELAKSALIEDPREDPTVRQNAANALGYLRNSQSVETLLSALEIYKKNDVFVTESIIWALGQIGDPKSIDDLVPLLSHEDEEIRYRTVWALAYCGDRSIEHIFLDVMESDSSARIRLEAEYANEWMKRRSNEQFDH